jgi:hypothetical protein
LLDPTGDGLRLTVVVNVKRGPFDVPVEPIQLLVADLAEKVLLAGLNTAAAVLLGQKPPDGPAAGQVVAMELVLEGSDIPVRKPPQRFEHLECVD